MLTSFLSSPQITQPFFRPPRKRCTTYPRIQTTCCNYPNPPSEQPKPIRRVMSPEARAKISAALKGRRKSDEHRANLRRRFGGPQNPMYGRKLSAETREKISRAMTARNKKKAEEARKPVIDEAILEGLREKAESSRLLQSQKEERKRPGRRLIDERGAKEMDKILERVARLDEPPEAVVRTIQNTENKRLERSSEQGEGAVDEKAKQEERTTCSVCQGSGMVSCPKCVGAFGVLSARCESCFGAGATFCAVCEGSGSLAR